ncbi:uncharacterized protein [Pocillopora verrucosa]
MLLSHEQFLGLFMSFLLTDGAWATATGIKYFLATCPGQNCDSVCATFGFQCAKTGQSFPDSSALPIFESLGISCKTINGSEQYESEERPCYFAESHVTKWVGVCVGFKGIPGTIDCHTANNTYIRRLCPCFDPTVSPITGGRFSTKAPPTATEPSSARRAPTTTEAPTTKRASATKKPLTPHIAPSKAGISTTKRALGTMEPSANQRTSAVKSLIPEERTGKPTGETKNTSSDNKEHSGANPLEQQIGTSGDADRTALIVVAVIAAVLALCLLGLAVIFMRNKRKFISQKEDTDVYNEKLNVKFSKNKSDAVLSDTMDGLAVDGTDQENRYASLIEKSTDNILYASVTEEKNICFVSGNNNHVYDR